MMLLIVRDRPFTFSVASSGRRGFQARLEVRGRERPGAPTQAMVVQSADNFDPNGLDCQGSVLLDRWVDSNRALSAVARDVVSLDGPDISPDDRQIITLKVIPLIKVDAAGLRWTDLGPFCPREDYEELAALMAAYAPGKRIDNVSKDGIGKLLRHLRELKSTEGIFDVDTHFISEGFAGRVSGKELADTDALFDVPTDFSQPLPVTKPAAAPAPAPAPAPVAAAEVQAVLTAASGLMGYLAHGAAIPARPAVPIAPAEAGGEVAVDIKLVIVNSPEALELARRKITSA
ncbi:hypothetical protein [Paraburkholderia ultramafica]|uniref:hypothetical protein n=1 Tax=Paraburkholderia ultramafica TaxID=1544867 RepID=UPI001583ABE0|nr:hypothetical protein [Paraburkholderia ultramafica]